jgi:hypothetical protein
VGKDVLGGDGQHGLDLVGEPVLVLLGVGVHTSGEGVEVRPEGRALGRVPVAGPLGEAHRPQQAIRVQMLFPPVLGGPAARLAVEPEDEVAVTVQLRPAEPVEESFGVVGVDVGHAPSVPQDLAVGRVGGGRDGRGALHSGALAPLAGGAESR